MITVAIPTYNSEKYVKETIQGVIEQTYKDIEILIVDNASTDRTVEIAKSFDDRRIRIIKNDSNIGGYANFNKCIDLAKGEFIFINHSDDVMMPDMLEKAYLIFSQNLEVSLICFNSKIIYNEQKTDQLYFNYTISNIMYNSSDFINTFFRIYPASISTSIFRTSFLNEKKIRFKNAIEAGQSADLVFWIDIFVNETYMYFISIPEIYRRLHENQWSADFGQTREYYLDYLNKTVYNIYRTIMTADNIDISTKETAKKWVLNQIFNGIQMKSDVLSVLKKMNTVSKIPFIYYAKYRFNKIYSVKNNIKKQIRRLKRCIHIIKIRLQVMRKDEYSRNGNHGDQTK